MYYQIYVVGSLWYSVLLSCSPLQGCYVFGRVGLSVCLSVSNITKVMKDCDEILYGGVWGGERIQITMLTVQSEVSPLLKKL